MLQNVDLERSLGVMRVKLRDLLVMKAGDAVSPDKLKQFAQEVSDILKLSQQQSGGDHDQLKAVIAENEAMITK